MPEVPPIGDPQRALHLAIRTMRLLGLVFVSFGLVAVVLAWLAIGRLINTPTVSWLALATAALVFFIPGVLYMVFAMLLARRHSWAAVGGIIVAVVQLLYALWTFAMAMARGSHAGGAGVAWAVDGQFDSVDLLPEQSAGSTPSRGARL